MAEPSSSDKNIHAKVQGHGGYQHVGTHVQSRPGMVAAGLPGGTVEDARRMFRVEAADTGVSRPEMIGRSGLRWKVLRIVLALCQCQCRHRLTVGS